MTRKKGILTVISGFSGAGKGTLIAALLDKYSYSLSVSATTRPPREGEQDGIHYFFVSKEDFEAMIQEDKLIEYANYVDNYYGTPKQYVEEKLEQGDHIILEIETKGAIQVKKLFPEAVLIFIAPPSAQELKNRLLTRETDSPDTVEKRLQKAKEEAGYLSGYDYLIVNETVDDSMEQIHRIIQSETSRMRRSTEFIESIKEEISAI